MKRNRRFYLTVLIGTLLSGGSYGQEIATRIQEVQSLQALACSKGAPGPRSTIYLSSLTAATNELRQRLKDLNQELTQAKLKAAASQDLEKQIAALGDTSKDVCTAAADFVQTSGAQPAPESTSVVVSKHSISFADQEVGTATNTTFAIKNKGKSAIELSAPELCDTSGLCDKDNTEFAIQPPEAGCPSLLDPADQCEYQVTYTPTHERRSAGVIKFKWKEDGRDKNDVVQLQGTSHVSEIAHLDSDGSGGTDPSTRAVLGFDISGATSAGTEQKAFLEFNLNAPIGRASKICVDPQSGLKARRVNGSCPQLNYAERQDPLNRRWWWYFNPRITSLAQDKSALSSLNIQGLNDFFNAKTTDLVQGVDLQGGVEWLFVKPRSGLSFSGAYKNARSRIGMAWIAGAGFTTPFSSNGSNPAVFTLPPNSPLRHFDPGTGQIVDIPSSFTNIAFVNRERSRFFRKYYTGLRLKTYQFSDKADGDFCDYPGEHCEALLNHFPGIIDLTVGQDEQVTAGRLMNWVFRLDAVYPLPFARGFNIFGSLNSALKKNTSTNPLVLPPTSTASLSDPSVFIVNVDPRSRDIYRIGIGIDILELLKKNAQPASAAKNAPAVSAATNPKPGSK